MVQAIENRSRVWCRPHGQPGTGPAEGWSTYTIRVERSEEIPGNAHLMADSAGREYQAIVPPALACHLADEDAWVVDVEVVGPNRVAVREIAS